MRLLSLSGVCSLPVFVLALHSALVVTAMPVTVDQPDTGSVAPLEARDIREQQLYFDILSEDPAHPGPHFAAWLIGSGKYYNGQKYFTIDNEGGQLKFVHSTPPEQLFPENVQLKAYQLGSFRGGNQPALTKQIEGLPWGKDQMSLFEGLQGFASNPPPPVTFESVPGDPFRLPTVFLQAMTKPDEFQREYGLPAESWRTAATEMPSEKAERLRRTPDNTSSLKYQEAHASFAYCTPSTSATTRGWLNAIGGSWLRKQKEDEEKRKESLKSFNSGLGLPPIVHED
ncbi:hypothetical protein C8R42DRAFT_646188 [Lentinula raphanica]|nr:hypothetical protein C8R42DRAFT_646188 [Lentinula raphanica]